MCVRRLTSVVIVLVQMVYAVLLLTLYWGIGASFQPENTYNIAVLLLIWASLAAYGKPCMCPPNVYGPTASCLVLWIASVDTL